MTFNFISWISHYDDVNDSMRNPPCPSCFLLDCLQNWQCLWGLIHTFRLCYLDHTILNYYIFKHIPQYYPNNSQKSTHITSSACTHCSLVGFSIQVKPQTSKRICSFWFTEQYRFLGDAVLLQCHWMQAWTVLPCN